MSSVRDQILDYIVAAKPQAAPEHDHAAVLASCDIAYSRHLMGLSAFEDATDFARHVDLLSRHQLAGTRGAGKDALNVHLTAYVLGTFNLAQDQHGAGVAAFVNAQEWDWTSLLRPDSLLPRWPWKYTHHSWRVSHWVGGAPSIIKSLWRLAPERCAQNKTPATAEVLTAADALIDARTGLLRTYKSEAIQFAFRQLYRLRHDPEAGDVGGIVHLHWVNYAEGRLPYKNTAALAERAWKLMQRKPFIEKVPYCLDFDIVQIVRTAAPSQTWLDDAIKTRSDIYARDVVDFFKANLNTGYALHKLPGALATVHECALIRGEGEAFGLGVRAIDIIEDAFWI